MRDAWRHFIAEFIGTFALVFVGGAAIMTVTQNQMPGGLVAVALAHGLILSIFVTALMRISGHFNPAVTLGFVASRRIDPTMAVIYIIAQLFGAIVAAYALKATFPADVFMATRGGGQSIALNTSGTQAWILEAIATFFLVFVIFGTAVDPKAPKVGGFAIGLAVAADILTIGPVTGASMNPARSFGPAFVSHIYEGQIIYWTAPIVGSIVAALLYDTLFIRREPEPLDHGSLEA